MVVAPQTIQAFATSQEASRVFVSRMEPGSRAQAIASDTRCTHDKAGFTKIGGPTNALHKRTDAMLADKPGARFERLQVAEVMWRMLPLWRIMAAVPDCILWNGKIPKLCNYQSGERLR